MTLVYTPESGGAPEATATPSSKQDDAQNPEQQLPPTVPATTTSTAPSYSPIHSAAQSASMSSLPAATEAATGQPESQAQPEIQEPERSTYVYTPSETTNPTPATTTSSSPPPPQPGAVPIAGVPAQGSGYGQTQARDQGQNGQEQGIPPPPKAGEVVAQGGVAEGAPAATADPNINPGIQSPTQTCGYGYGYAAQQQQYLQYQQTPNSTTTPYNTVYPRHPSNSYQSPYSIPNNNIMQDELDTSEKGFLDLAKGWVQTAGEKLVQVEAEVWRRINEAHDGDQ